MNWIIATLCVLAFAFVVYVFEVGYPKYGWFKNFMHNKLGMCEPDFDNHLDYCEHSKNVKTRCKYCKKKMVYYNICKYLVYENPKQIPESVHTVYCRECMSKNYTKNRRCCPRYCDGIAVCRMCGEGLNNE